MIDIFERAAPEARLLSTKPHCIRVVYDVRVCSRTIQSEERLICTDALHRYCSRYTAGPEDIHRLCHYCFKR